MIIKGLFRRYQRWNPVHPTSGTFWGMGIGVGCGVGWGPGFGPQVVGYVGAGCGVGFSVGFSLLGVGIGLPTKHSIKIPNNETRTRAVELLKSSSLCFMRNVEDGWNRFGSLIPLQKEASGKTNGFKHKGSLDHRVGITMVNPGFSSNFKSVLTCLESLRDRCLHHTKGYLQLNQQAETEFLMSLFPGCRKQRLGCGLDGNNPVSS